MHGSDPSLSPYLPNPTRARSNSLKRMAPAPLSPSCKKACLAVPLHDVSNQANTPLDRTQYRNPHNGRRMTVSVSVPPPASPFRSNAERPRDALFRSQSFQGTADSPTRMMGTQFSQLSIARGKDEALFIDTHPLKLETLKNSAHDGINVLSVDTFSDLLNNKRHNYSKIRIFDCRFDYEFDGGHIMGAENFPVPDELIDHMRHEIRRTSLEEGARVCIVIHCEFSSHRGPTAYRRIRDLDRKENSSRHPNLTFPEMYLLAGGYKAFYNAYLDFCQPRSYLEMLDPGFSHELKAATARAKGPPKLIRKGLSRSCSNIFLEREVFEEQNPDAEMGNCHELSGSGGMDFAMGNPYGAFGMTFPQESTMAWETRQDDIEIEPENPYAQNPSAYSFSVFEHSTPTKPPPHRKCHSQPVKRETWPC